jgi:serine/threonine protein kinase
MNYPAICGKCGAELPASSPGGHCLKCLLQLGLDANTVRENLSTEKSGDRIGAFKLLEQIGEGGCGVVYLAEQEQPVRRRVALKIIKLGMDTKQVIARFEAERQALALMEHPNIARVFDAGATDAGRPYFVMELVQGSKITEYCDAKRLTIRQRLDLFVQVCQAVQHAHQKGVIHRDLKPSNILVMEQDGRAVPKIIDFGIAKATTDQRLTDKTLFTAFEIFMGTPAYMSPEQASLGGMDVDTRSDIYSLGVLLYELLCGQAPFDAATLQKAAFEEVLHIIRKIEPERPAARVTKLPNKDATEVAARRQTEATKLPSLLRGELDWIVMKALEKDRNRRYSTANGFAQDVERFLANEPVAARPPSKWYQFKKMVKRNKSVSILSAALVIALVILAVGSVLLLLQARRNLRESKVEEFRQEWMDAGGRNESFMGAVKQEAYLRQRLAMLRQYPGYPGEELSHLRDLVGALWLQGKLSEAESTARQAVEIAKTVGKTNLPATMPYYLMTPFADLAHILLKEDKLAEAEPILRDLYKTGIDSSSKLSYGAELSVLLWQQGKYEEAEKFRQSVLNKSIEQFSPDLYQSANNCLRPLNLLASSTNSETGTDLTVPSLGDFRFVNPNNNCIINVKSGQIVLSVSGTNNVVNSHARGGVFLNSEGKYTEYGLVNRAPALLREVEGDFVIEAKITGDFEPGLFNLPASRRRNFVDRGEQDYPYSAAGLILRDTDQHFLTLTRWAMSLEYVSKIGEWTPIIRYWRNSVHFMPQSGYPGEMGQPRVDGGQILHMGSKQFTWLRLAREGDVVHASLSMDGKEWLQTETIPTHLPRKIQVGVYAGKNMIKRFDVTFSNFKLISGGTNGP